MMEWMVHAAFHPQDRQSIVQRIPQEQEHVRALMQQGTIEALYIASDFSGVWLVMRGESRDQIQETLASFPLYPFMQVTITPLSRM